MQRNPRKPHRLPHLTLSSKDTMERSKNTVAMHRIRDNTATNEKTCHKMASSSPQLPAIRHSRTLQWNGSPVHRVDTPISTRSTPTAINTTLVKRSISFRGMEGGEGVSARRRSLSESDAASTLLLASRQKCESVLEMMKRLRRRLHPETTEREVDEYYQRRLSLHRQDIKSILRKIEPELSHTSTFLSKNWSSEFDNVYSELKQP